jgi:hypothetical protein
MLNSRGGGHVAIASSVKWIGIVLTFHVDPDQIFHFDADPDPASTLSFTNLGK